MGTTGAPLNLNLPTRGEIDWDTLVNANFSAINTEVAALQSGGSTGPAGATGAAGAVGMIFAGAWNGSTAYIVPDVVTYNGGSYLAIASSTNAQPDVNPNSWAVLSAAGAAGPAGPTGPIGPQGPSGAGGTVVTFPITVVEGGTGATTAAAARTNLAAAQNDVNGDITRLTAVVTTAVQSDPPGITITSPGGRGTALSVSNGTSSGGITTDAIGYFTGVECSGQVICGGLTSSALLEVSEIGNSVPGGSVTIAAPLIAGNTLLVQGATPAGGSGQLGIGVSTASSATAGGAGSLPSTYLGMLIFTLNGSIIKIPFYSN